MRGSEFKGYVLWVLKTRDEIEKNAKSIINRSSIFRGAAASMIWANTSSIYGLLCMIRITDYCV